MKVLDGIHYNIKDFGHRVDLESNSLYGLAGGIVHLTKENYDICYDSCTVVGSMYIIPATKGKESKEENNQISILKEEIKELTEEIEALEKVKTDNRILKSQVTKLQNKVKKLES